MQPYRIPRSSAEWQPTPPEKIEQMLYPLKFRPRLKKRIWGGRLLSERLGKRIPKDAVVGESWEISGVDGDISIVSNGLLAGNNLEELIEVYMGELVGDRVYEKFGLEFPLLIKYIDAQDKLSVQVHPDDKLAAERHFDHGKTEMWYIVAARKGAQILAGLQGRATRQQLVSRLDSPEVENLLQVYPSLPGDAYFITSGTLHAIGGGNLILEIQQNSDTTYRVSDWGRVDAHGNPRELHIEKGIQSINFMNRTSPRIVGVTDHVSHNRKFDVVNSCPFFTVSDLRLTELWSDDTGSFGSFHMISAINGAVRLGKADDPARCARLEAGETALIPACFGSYVIVPEREGETTVVKTTL